jgi:hypothetical protein
MYLYIDRAPECFILMKLFHIPTDVTVVPHNDTSENKFTSVSCKYVHIFYVLAIPPSSPNELNYLRSSEKQFSSLRIAICFDMHGQFNSKFRTSSSCSLYTKVGLVMRMTHVDSLAFVEICECARERLSGRV